MGQGTNCVEVEVLDSPVQRLLNYARRCRTRDLQQLHALCALVKGIAELVHALQKERGASSIFVGSQGEQFTEPLAERVVDSVRLEQIVRARLGQIDDQLEFMRCGARFYTCVALAYRALESLSATRTQIVSLLLVPRDAVDAFTEIIGSLLAVTFEIADLTYDPVISRALMALVNFSQGKEYAGQERATAGAALSRGSFFGDECRRLQQLIAAQEQAFRIFCDFAQASRVAAYHLLLASKESAELGRMRTATLAAVSESHVSDITAAGWYEQTTRRIDAMKQIEDGLADDLNQLCEATLAEDQSLTGIELDRAPQAMLLAAIDPTLQQAGVAAGIGIYAVHGAQARPLRPILALLRAQSRRIDEVSHQLESARSALLERKSIERAKGLLMKSRGISEQAAYEQIRDTAMNQNKRIADIAEAIISMAAILERP